MNLLPGRLHTNADAGLAAVLGPDAAVALGSARLPDLDGREITLGIRPQDVRVEPRGAAGTLPATVFAFEPLQEIGRLTLNLVGTDQRIVVETHHDMVAAPGDTVGLRFDLLRTHLFDTATGERLPWESAPAPMTR